MPDYYEMLKDARAATTTIAYPFVTFVDLTESAAPPSQVLSTGRHSSIDNAEPIMTVIVGMGRLNEMLMGIFQRMFPKAIINMRTARSLEEGMALAKETLANAQK